MYWKVKPMNNNFFDEVERELERLNLAKKTIDSRTKIWTKELQEEYKLLKTKIKVLKDVNKYFDPLDKIFTHEKKHNAFVGNSVAGGGE